MKKIKDNIKDAVLLADQLANEFVKSYKDIATRQNSEAMEETCLEGEEEVGEKGNEEEWMKVKLKLIEGYKCHTFVLYVVEENRIYHPWRRELIVKLLGKKFAIWLLKLELNKRE